MIQANAEIPQQNAFRAVDDLLTFEPVCKFVVLGFQAGTFNLRFYNNAEGGEQTTLQVSVLIPVVGLHRTYAQ